VVGIVPVDLLEGCRRLLSRVEGKESASGGDELAEPGLLRHHRLARGEIANAAVAEPPAARAGVQVVRHGELPPGGVDLLPVGIRVTGFLVGVRQLPAPLEEQLPRRRVDNLERQLERLGRQSRQVDEAQEVDVLGPVVRLPLESHVLVHVLPCADGGEMARRGIEVRLP